MAIIHFPISMLLNQSDSFKFYNDILIYAEARIYENAEGTHEEKVKMVESSLCAYLTNNSEENYERIVREYPKVKGEPYASVSDNFLWSLAEMARDGKNSSIEIAKFLFCCAITSIQGNKTYAITTKNMILSRMCGRREKTNEKFYSKFVKEWATRRKFDKLVEMLRISKEIIYEAPKGFHGVYVTTKITYKELLEIIDENKNKIKFKYEMEKLKNEYLAEKADRKRKLLMTEKVKEMFNQPAPTKEGKVEEITDVEVVTNTLPY